MLPTGNEMVEKTNQAKKVMRLMGSGYKKILVCIKNYLLYWKNDKDLTACRTCGTSRWKVDNKTMKLYENIPAKQKKAFNGQQEFLQAPIPITGEQIYNENVAESIVGTLLRVPGKTKDGLNARLDLAELGLKPKLFA
ncbi:hypothetical protein Tco_0995359, partial [Tanacetum coccineum]